MLLQMSSALPGFGSMFGGKFGDFLGGLGGLFGGIQGGKMLEQGRNDILNLPGMQGPMNLAGNFGASANGMFAMDPSMMSAQQAIGGMIPGLLGGQGFMTPSLQNAMQGINFGQQFNQADALLGQQANPFYSQQGFGNLYNQNQAMNAQLMAGFQGGPQDLTGGMQQGLMGMGMGNMMNAGNQQNIYNQQLDVLRQSAAPEINRQQNQLMDRLYSKGLLGAGTTATGEAMRGFQEAVGQQDLGFQNRAFDTAMAQQQFLGNLGQGQMGLGQGLMGQNLGFYGDQANRLLQGIGLGGQLEGQGFGQQLQALQQNQSAGMNRLAQAQGLFGFGGDQMSKGFNLGLGGLEGLLGLGQFGLEGAALPYQLQASLLGASGYHAQSLGDMAQALSSQKSGFLGGLFS